MRDLEQTSYAERGGDMFFNIKEHSSMLMRGLDKIAAIT
jgi:hypothetical protein